MVCKGHNKTYDFRKFKTIRSFGNYIRSNFIKMYTENDEPFDIQHSMLKNLRQDHKVILNLKGKRRRIK